MTLIGGVTVGGHKIADQDQILRIKSGWSKLFRLIESDQFALTKETAIHLNELIARDEAIKVGNFRYSQVWLKNVEYSPPSHRSLDRRFKEMLSEVDQRNTPLDRAVMCFAICARNQFFFDGNRRTAQLLMNGILLSSGLHAITIPGTDLGEYHYLIREWYETGGNQKISLFLKDRQLDKIGLAMERRKQQLT